jgi:phenylacetate-CoA ligase
MIWNEEFETLPREQLEILQIKRLKDLVERVYYRVKPYRIKMDAAGIKPEHIKSLGDLQKLPLSGCPGACIIRHDRKTDSCRLHQAGY